MRRFVLSTFSSRQAAAYHRKLNGGYGFSGSQATGYDRAVPPQSCEITCPTHIQNQRCFMFTQVHPAVDTDIRHKEIKDEENEAVNVKVISREHIKPSSPTPQNLRYYKLSMFDQMEIPLSHPYMFFYLNENDNDNKNINDVIRDRSNLLKQSLSETLTRFYPCAGKIASELHIDCNDDGLCYIETRVNDSLRNVLTKPDNKFLKRLLPVVNLVSSQPMLGSYVSMVQVNFFNCGSFSVTIQPSHKFQDARSHMIFINTWAAIARRDPNQIYPSFDLPEKFPQNPQQPYSPYIPIWYLQISPAYLKHAKCDTKRFVFNDLALQRLKTEASKHQPVSRFVAVLSLIMKCVMTETKTKPSVIQVPFDMRKRVSPPMPETSVGNIISGVVVTLDPDESNSELASIGNHIQNDISNFKAESFEELKGENGHVRMVENLRKTMEKFCDYGSEYYWSTSTCNFGGTEADFGWGKPVWYCTGNHLNDDIPIFMNRIILNDLCSGKGIEVWVSLEKQVMEGVTCNAELLSFASIDPSPLIM